MLWMRKFVVRHARGFEHLYRMLERSLVVLDPVFFRIGYQRVERPVAAVERLAKGLLFDCRMCGQCILGSTGMSCPMNCPKQLRNGPCGGVGADGLCEVKPEMSCVWVEAWNGAARMKFGDRIEIVQPPVDRTLQGSSAWLRVSREMATRHYEIPARERQVLARFFAAARKADPASAPLGKEPGNAISAQRDT